MRNKTAFLLFLLLLLFGAFPLAFSVQAQQMPFDITWEKGTVYLTSGDSVSGPVVLTLPRDIVSVRLPDGSISAFAPVNVLGFRVHQERNVNNLRDKYGPLEFMRNYQTFMWNHNKDYSNFLSPAFFVVVQPGNFTLLMRETKIMVPASRGSYYGNNSYRTERIVQHFYLSNANTGILPLRNPRKDLQQLFPKLKDDLVKFAKSNKLDFDDPIELARIIEYCNRSI